MFSEYFHFNLVGNRCKSRNKKRVGQIFFRFLCLTIANNSFFIDEEDNALIMSQTGLIMLYFCFILSYYPLIVIKKHKINDNLFGGYQNKVLFLHRKILRWTFSRKTKLNSEILTCLLKHM